MSASSNAAGNSESRLLRKLEDAIQRERDPGRAACLRAEWASMHARQGRTDIARAEVVALRKEFEGRQNLELTAWICIVESLAAFYLNVGQESQDRMKRALALSTSAGIGRLIALSATSLAFMNIYDDNPEEMGRHLQIAVAALKHADSGTIARTYLAGAVAYHWADEFERARPLYMAARQEAQLHGDDVFLGALNRQLSTMRATNAKVAALLGLPYEDDARRALTAAGSSASLDQHIGNESHATTLPSVQASMAAVQGRFQEAIDLYAPLLPQIDAEGFGDSAAQILADIAWCFAMLGDAKAAADYAERATSAHQDSHHIEDQVLEFGRLSQVYRILGDVEAERIFAARTDSAMAGYRKLQERFLTAVAAVNFPKAGHLKES